MFSLFYFKEDYFKFVKQSRDGEIGRHASLRS